jgi:hypothetical protein
LERANQAYGHAADWDYWYGGEEAKKRSHPLMAVLLFGILFVSMGLAAAIIPQLGLPSEVLNVVMPVVTLGIFVTVIGAYMVWFFRGRTKSKRAVALRTAGINCPSCGAPHALVPGEVLERCRFCNAALVPDRSAIAQVRARADDELLRAEITEQRAQRRGMLALSRTSAASIIPYIVFGSFLPMTLGGALAATGEWLLSIDNTPIAAVVVLWAMASLNLGLLALVYAYRRARDENWRTRLARVGSRLGARSLTGIEEVNAWLDRHWASAVPLTNLFPGPCVVAIAATVEGYPVQVVANPVGASQDYPGYLVVRVGAWLPVQPLVQSTPSFEAARRVFEAQGFALEIARAGLLVSATQRSTRHWGKSGDTASFADAVSWLARAAREVGASPVDVP